VKEVNKAQREAKKRGETTFTCSKKGYPSLEIIASDRDEVWEKYTAEVAKRGMRLKPNEYINIQYEGKKQVVRSKDAEGYVDYEEEAKKADETIKKGAVWLIAAVLILIAAFAASAEAGGVVLVVYVGAAWFYFGCRYANGENSASNKSSSNTYKAFSVHQRNQQQKELNELNDQVEDMNDRFDGFG
jgi:hypothetical protein